MENTIQNPKTQNEQRKRLSRVFLCLTAFLCTSFLLQLFLQFLIFRVLGISPGADLSNIALILSSIPMYCAAFPLTLRLFRFIPEAQPYKHGRMLPFSVLAMLFCICYCLMIAGNLLGNGLMRAVSYDTPNVVDQLVGTASPFLLLLSTVIAAPVAEELLLRKLLIDRCICLGERTAIFLSAFAFGLMHGNLFQFFYAFFLGGLFAYIYVRTRDVRNTICLHVAVNMTGGLIPALLLKLPAGPAAVFGQSLFGLVSLLFFFFGVIGILRNRRRIYVCGREFSPFFRSAWLRTVFLTPGMLLFLSMCLMLFMTSM